MVSTPGVDETPARVYPCRARRPEHDCFCCCGDASGADLKADNDTLLGAPPRADVDFGGRGRPGHGLEAMLLGIKEAREQRIGVSPTTAAPTLPVLPVLLADNLLPRPPDTKRSCWLAAPVTPPTPTSLAAWSDRQFHRLPPDSWQPPWSSSMS